MSRGQQSSPVFGGYGGAMGNPFVAIRRMMEDMDRLVSNFGLGGFLTPSLLQDQFGIGNQRSAGGGLSTLWNPQVDIHQRGENLVIRADLPGIKKDDVSVEIDRNVLTIRGERKNEFEDESEGLFRSERSYGSFQRSIPLPEGVTAESAQATFNNGVLEVRIPVPRGQAGSKRIEIR
jgi:HSP20 family protein